MRTLAGKVVAITGRRKRDLDAAAKVRRQYVTVRPQGAPYGAPGPVATPQEESMKTARHPTYRVTTIGFCQLFEAGLVTRQTGMLPRSSLPLRQPAPCP